MVGQLGRKRQRGDPGKPPADDTEVDGGDREPRERAAAGAADTCPMERVRPEEGDPEVDGHSGREQPPSARLLRQQDRARGAGGCERVAAGRERVRR